MNPTTEEIVKDAKDVWLLNNSPSFPPDTYSLALQRIVEQHLIHRSSPISDPRVGLLLNAAEAARAAGVEQ